MRHTLPCVSGFLLLLVIGASPAAGQSLFQATHTGSPAAVSETAERDSRFAPQFTGAPPAGASATLSAERPKVLTGLYVSLAAMHMVDAMSTRTALNHGAVELNTAMRGSIGQQLGVKAAMSLGTVAIAERLWRKNKVAAIATVVAANGALALVSANNFRNAGKLR